LPLLAELWLLLTAPGGTGVPPLQGEPFPYWQSHNYFSQLLKGLEYLNSKVSLDPPGRVMTTSHTYPGGTGVPPLKGKTCPSWQNRDCFSQLLEGLQYLQGELFLSWQSHNYFSQLLVGLEYLNSKVSLAPPAVWLLPTATGGAGVPLFQGEPCPSWKSMSSSNIS
jgi:hypothetical protein